jgi:NADH:ubiquinone oxidoreductase subunit 4 (subunit M)
LDFGSHKLMAFVFFSLTIFCFQVFTTSHLFYLYFYYEASLIPILFIIIKWGSYPERSVRAIIMLLYTLLFGAPVLVLIIYFNTWIGSWLYPSYDYSSSSLLFSMLIFLCFSVKLPVYGLHFWLPIAHVEAPTFGSVILARILLKLGGVGLLRLRLFMNQSYLSNSILSYFIIFIIYSSLVCCYQSDLKRLIAYSSVAHMMVIPFLVISNNILAVQALVLVMLLHGLSSTLLFMSVGILYSMFSSRQLVLIRGLVLTSPLFSFILIITFLFTLSAPPLPSYVAEVFFILSSYMLRPYMIYVVLLFAFFGLVYNLNWLIRTLFATRLNMSYSNSNLSFSSFLPVLSTLLAVLPFLSLFFML